MKDLALEDDGISPIGVTAPFPLFTREGVTELRRNILSQEVLDKFTVSSYISAFQGESAVSPGVEGSPSAVVSSRDLSLTLDLFYAIFTSGREFTKDVAPFVHAAWTSPEVIRAVSEAAGIDLVPVCVYRTSSYISCCHELTCILVPSMEIELG